VLGFPTAVRPGFFIFMLLLVLLYPFPLGLWVAGAVAAFTLIHELGHALAARSAGCDARIALDFMVAYAAYETRRPLTWWQRGGIALAGPATQVGVAVIVLAALGASPFSRESITQSNVTMAVWWAGVALGLLNLVPLIPLDGGAIVANLIDAVAPGRGRQVMVRISFGATLFLFVVAVFTPVARPLIPFLALLGFMQWQALTLGGLSPAEVMRSLVDEWTAAPGCAAAVDNARAAVSLDAHEWVAAWLEAAERTQVDAGEFARCVGDARDFAPSAGHPRVAAVLARVVAR
jgi:Zn-dependent protease